MGKLQIDMLKKLSTGEILTPLIDIYQSRGEFPDEWVIKIDNFKRKPDLAFHPSSDCAAKPSELYARLMGEPTRSIPAGLRRVFDCGHFRHGYYQEIAHELGLTTRENIERSVKFSHPDGWEARGTADLIIDMPRKGTWLVDMKTMNDVEFDEGPYPSTLFKWSAQVNMYMEWLEIDRAFILAIRKGGTPGRGGGPAHALREISIPYDKELVDAVYAKWSYVWDCFKTETLPEDENWS